MLMVTRLDRLARSIRDLLNTLAAITSKQAGFRSLGDTWADTTTAHGRLVKGGRRFGGIRSDLIRTRTGEGRARARRAAITRRERGDETLAEIDRSYNVSGWTISRLSG
jgi:DNA invertase Pin-like site-specific DNA recombinase